jgi:HD-GYP domain-containing protein (c-di-GMP phosphodiesterase class II)
VWQRGRQLGAFVLTGGAPMAELVRSHCLSAGLFAERLGLGSAVRDALAHSFERWDGKGLPGGLRHEQLPLEMRIIHLADILEVHHHLRGPAGAIEVARARSGTKFDPSLVEIFCREAPRLLASLEVEDAWQAVVDAAPVSDSELTEHELDAVLEVMADFADVKSAYTAGHSRGVAALAAEAAANMGLSTAEIVELRRAALVHDLGRMGVSNTIWDKVGPLSPPESERVRLHPYLTERMLNRPAALRRLGQLASRHHERLDGSGYPHGLPAAALVPSARLLAAADAYHAMLEPRPHRPPLAAEDAARELRSAARLGRLDSEAADAILRAAGHRVGRRGAWPAGLTAREVEVLGLVARGSSNRDIATRLSISEKTVRNHLEHIYSKAAVSNRTGATLFAIEHGLTGHFPYPPVD